MNWSALWDWLFTEAGAGWVFGIVSLATLLVTSARRHRPGRVLVRDLHRTSLVRIRPDVRRRIAVAFDGATVSALGAIEVEVTNEGSDVIRDPQITIVFGGGARVLEASSAKDHADLPVRVETREESVVVSLPFLNPFKDHRQGVRLSCVVDGSLRHVSVRGSGDGWSVVHKPLLDRQSFVKRQRAINRAMGAFLPLLGIYFWWTSRFRGIGFNEWSWRAFYSNIPVLIVFGVLVFIVVRTTKAAGPQSPRIRMQEDFTETDSALTATTDD